MKVICDHATKHPRICSTCDHGVEHEPIMQRLAFLDCRSPVVCRMRAGGRILERETRCVESRCSEEPVATGPDDEREGVRS